MFRRLTAGFLARDGWGKLGSGRGGTASDKSAA